MDRKKSPPPDRHPRAPKLELPPGACDTHFHFFGPQDVFPLHPQRAIDIDDSTIDDWLAMQQALGLSRGLFVQSFIHRNSYEQMLHALCRLPDRLRGVAMPWSGITDRELEILSRAGVVGMRFSPIMGPAIDLGLRQRVHERGWSAHYLVRSLAEVESWRAAILSSPGKFVIEHSGFPPPEKGLDSPEFRFVLECLDTGRAWVKLSPRFTKEKVLPFSDTTPFIHKLVAHAPGRMLWGSDWPHPNYWDPMPNDADLLDLMLDWVPDEATRRRIFVDNPADLLGFPPVAG